MELTGYDYDLWEKDIKEHLLANCNREGLSVGLATRFTVMNDPNQFYQTIMVDMVYRKNKRGTPPERAIGVRLGENTVVDKDTFLQLLSVGLDHPASQLKFLSKAVDIFEEVFDTKLVAFTVNDQGDAGYACSTEMELVFYAHRTEETILNDQD